MGILQAVLREMSETKASGSCALHGGVGQWIADHNANPERRRVVDPKAVQKAQVKIKF